MAKQNVALVAGATGIVGQPLVNLLSKPDTPGAPWKIYALARRPRPDWVPTEVTYIQTDLLNRDDAIAKISSLTDITHLFFVTWVARATEAENVTDNGALLRNTLDAIVPYAKSFQHIALQTGVKHYIGSFASAMAVTFDTPFRESEGRLEVPNFYYTQEDIVFDVVDKSEGKLTWSVHRPGAIYGAAEGNLINQLGSIAVYATICKHENLPFKFPGTEFSWNAIQDGSSADLVAEQEVWAATDPRGKNQAFNSLNGDQFRWRRMWKALAEKLGVEYVPFDGMRALTAESMKGMESVWEKIVEENGLRKVKLEDAAQWWVLDLTLAFPSDSLVSMNKSKERGFLAFRNTEKDMLAIVDKMRAKKLIP